MFQKINELGRKAAICRDLVLQISKKIICGKGWRGIKKGKERGSKQKEGFTARFVKTEKNGKMMRRRGLGWLVTGKGKTREAHQKTNRWDGEPWTSRWTWCSVQEAAWWKTNPINGLGDVTVTEVLQVLHIEKVYEVTHCCRKRIKAECGAPENVTRGFRAIALGSKTCCAPSGIVAEERTRSWEGKGCEENGNDGIGRKSEGEVGDGSRGLLNKSLRSGGGSKGKGMTRMLLISKFDVRNIRC